VSHTLLAPDLVGAIPDGKQPRTLELQLVMRQLSVEWDRRRRNQR
jgi:hypothetical protein